MNFKVEADAYAIRHIPTGRFMIQPFGKLPRLFNSRRGAATALTCWLKGEWESVWETSDWDQKRFKIGAAPPTNPPLDRIASEMEIVEFKITEV